jgi:hypothetical protein
MTTEVNNRSRRAALVTAGWRGETAHACRQMTHDVGRPVPKPVTRIADDQPFQRIDRLALVVGDTPDEGKRQTVPRAGRRALRRRRVRLPPPAGRIEVGDDEALPDNWHCRTLSGDGHICSRLPTCSTRGRRGRTGWRTVSITIRPW